MRSIFVSFTLGRASVVTTHLTGQAFPGIYSRHSRLELRTSSRKLCTCNRCTCSCTCTLSDESLLAGRGGPICPVRGRSRMCLVSIQWKLEQWNVSLGGRFTWAGRNFPVGGGSGLLHVPFASSSWMQLYYLYWLNPCRPTEWWHENCQTGLGHSSTMGK